MSALLSQINSVAIQHVLEGDAADLKKVRDAICKWIKFEIQKSQPHGVDGATAAAIYLAIQKFIAAVHAAQRYAKAKQAADAINSEYEVKVEFEELKSKMTANHVLEGAEKDRYDEILDRLSRMDADLAEQQSIFVEKLNAVWAQVPDEFKPAGSQWGPK
jgi:hypothetical protein